MTFYKRLTTIGLLTVKQHSPVRRVWSLHSIKCDINRVCVWLFVWRKEQPSSIGDPSISGIHRSGSSVTLSGCLCDCVFRTGGTARFCRRSSVSGIHRSGCHIVGVLIWNGTKGCSASFLCGCITDWRDVKVNVVLKEFSWHWGTTMYSFSLFLSLSLSLSLAHQMNYN